MKIYPIPLQPMNFSNLIENAFKIYRGNWKKILIVSLLVSGVIIFIMQMVAYLQIIPFMNKITQIITSSGDMQNYFNSVTPSASDYLNNMISEFIANWVSNSMIWFFASVIILSFINSLVATPFVTSYVSRVSSSYFHGDVPDVKATAKRSARDIGRLILTILAGAVIMFGVTSVVTIIMTLVVLGMIFISPFIVILLLLLIIPVIFVILVFSMVISFSLQVTIHEGSCGFQAIARGMKMLIRKFWLAIGVTLVSSLMVQVIAGSIIGFFNLFIYMSPVFTVISALMAAVATAVTIPFIYIVYTLLYLDLKIENEGYYTTLMMEDDPSV